MHLTNTPEDLLKLQYYMLFYNEPNMISFYEFVGLILMTFAAETVDLKSPYE